MNTNKLFKQRLDILNSISNIDICYNIYDIPEKWINDELFFKSLLHKKYYYPFYVNKIISNHNIALVLIKNNSKYFKILDKKLQNDKKFISSVILINKKVIKYLPDKFKYDQDILQYLYGDNDVLEIPKIRNIDEIKDVIFKLISKNPSSRYLSDWKDYKKLILLMYEKKYNFIYNSLSDEFKIDEEISIAAVNSYEYEFIHIDTKHPIYEELAMIVVDKNPNMLMYIPKDTNKYNYMAITAIKKQGDVLRFASDYLKDREDVVLLSFNNNCETMLYASYRLLCKKDLVLKFIKYNRNNIYFIPNYLKKDIEIIMEAIIINNNEYNFPTCFIEDRLLIKTTLEHNGLLYRYLKHYITDDRELFLISVKNNPNAFQFTNNEKFMDDEEIAITVVSKMGLMLSKFSKKIRSTLEVAIAAINNDPLAIKFVDNSLLENKNFIFATSIKNNFNPKKYKKFVTIQYFSYKDSNFNFKNYYCNIICSYSNNHKYNKLGSIEVLTDSEGFKYISCSKHQFENNDIKFL